MNERSDGRKAASGEFCFFPTDVDETWPARLALWEGGWSEVRGETHKPRQKAWIVAKRVFLCGNKLVVKKPYLNTLKAKKNPKPS